MDFEVSILQSASVGLAVLIIWRIDQKYGNDVIIFTELKQFIIIVLSNIINKIPGLEYCNVNTVEPL